MKKNTAPKGIKIKMSREEIAYQIFIAVVVGLLVLCCLIPFLYVVGMSFTSEGEMIQRNFFVIIPQKPILAAYEYLLKNKDFFSGMGITIIRTAMGVCTALILTVPVGYILAIGDLPFKNGIMVFFITTMVLSGGIIPTYILYRDLHLLNSFWVYIVPSLANTYGMLDGANERQKMIHIAIPLLKPTLCALGLFAAVAHWNSWMDAMIYNSRNSAVWPAQFVIRNLLQKSNNADIMKNINTYAKMTSESMKMASVILAVLPILCVYPFLQKYFVKGMYTGSVKG